MVTAWCYMEVTISSIEQKTKHPFKSIRHYDLLHY